MEILGAWLWSLKYNIVPILILCLSSMVLYPFFLSVAVTQYPLFLSQFHSSTHSFSQSQLHNTIPVFYLNSTSNLLFSSDRPMYLSIPFNTNILFILIFCCTPYFFEHLFVWSACRWFTVCVCPRGSADRHVQVQIQAHETDPHVQGPQTSHLLQI